MICADAYALNWLYRKKIFVLFKSKENNVISIFLEDVF